jgi:hypothetical protein
MSAADFVPEPTTSVVRRLSGYSPNPPASSCVALVTPVVRTRGI